MTQNENANIGQWYENPVDDEESNEQQKEEADDTIRAFAAKALAYKQQIKEKENENAMEELMSSLGPSERQQLAEGFLGNGAYDEPQMKIIVRVSITLLPSVPWQKWRVSE